MTRVCFQLQVRPDRLEEYTARHASVWPEMLRALPTTGWHNYSLFLRADGLLIGYLETPTSSWPRRAWPPPRSTPAGRREMAEFFEDLDDAHPTRLPPARGDLPPRGPARCRSTTETDEK